MGSGVGRGKGRNRGYFSREREVLGWFVSSLLACRIVSRLFVHLLIHTIFNCTVKNFHTLYFKQKQGHTQSSVVKDKYFILILG